jgi:chromosome partitioning protein
VARILAVANQKGGVAKTTTIVNLAAALVEHGSRVLVVDLDAQACATFSLGLDPEDLERTGADAFMSREPALPVRSLVVTTDDGVDLLPAAIDLAGADRALASVVGREYVVRDAIEPVLGSYEWILLDCSPSLGIITINALTAADAVLIPLQCETLSHRGVGQLLETIADVQRLTNPDLQIAAGRPMLALFSTTSAPDTGFGCSRRSAGRSGSPRRRPQAAASWRRHRRRRVPRTTGRWRPRSPRLSRPEPRG